MAKPISATPTLKGKDAERFVKRMDKPLNDKEKDFVKKSIAAYKRNPF